MTTIYVLECEEGHYYVGATARPDIRIPGHFRGIIDGWTPRWLVRHPPIRVLDQYIVVDSNEEENKKTLELINKYGIEKVAGGKYVLPKVRNKLLSLH